MKAALMRMQWVDTLRVLWLASALFAVLFLPMTAHADQDSCALGSAAGAQQCLSAKLSELRERLQQAYERVLEKTPSASVFDERKTALQLRKAQSAWEAYALENCSYVGGLRGGSNAWVSVFVTQCLVKEVEMRIQFFEHLPSGG